jgi:hypothetical protein
VAQAVAGPQYAAAVRENDVERFSAMTSEILHRVNGAMDAARTELCGGIQFSPSVCHHEAGHAVAAVHFGARVGRVNVNGSCQASATFNDGGAWQAWVSIFQAGPIAERWLARIVDRSSDQAFKFAIAAARASERKPCDDCRAIAAILDAHPDATDSQAVAAYRQIEEQTIALVQRPDVWRSIRAVANGLAEHGHLVDAGVRERCEPSVIGAAASSSFEGMEKLPRVLLTTPHHGGNARARSNCRCER